MPDTATLHQKIIDLRYELIKKRIECDKLLQANNLLERRTNNLEAALKAIMERSNESEAYTSEAYIHHIAYKAIHSD